MIGGWGIKLRNFEVCLVDRNSKRPLELKKLKVKTQSHYKGKRAKNIWSFEIYTKSIFKIVIKHIDSLYVKHSNLNLTNFLYSKPKVDNDSIEIRHIHKCPKMLFIS